MLCDLCKERPADLQYNVDPAKPRRICSVCMKHPAATLAHLLGITPDPLHGSGPCFYCKAPGREWVTGEDSLDRWCCPDHVTAGDSAGTTEPDGDVCPTCGRSWGNCALDCPGPQLIKEEVNR